MKPVPKIRKIRAGSGHKAREPLSRERIELAALDLIEDDGLENFSTRRLGERLGCEAMSIYHHFPSKAHLLNALLDRVLAERPMPGGELAPLERIRRITYWYRQIGIDHPKLFQYIALHRMNGRSGLAVLDGIIGAFHDLGFDAEATARLFRSFSYYLTGGILDETSGYAKGPSATEPVSDDEISRDFPNVAMVGPYFKPGHFERTFDTGLGIFLGAIEREARSIGKSKKRR